MKGYQTGEEHHKNIHAIWPKNLEQHIVRKHPAILRLLPFVVEVSQHSSNHPVYSNTVLLRQMNNGVFSLVSNLTRNSGVSFARSQIFSNPYGTVFPTSNVSTLIFNRGAQQIDDVADHCSICHSVPLRHLHTRIVFSNLILAFEVRNRRFSPS